MQSGLRACKQERYQLCSITASQSFDKYFACIDWSCCTARCKYFIRNSLVVASIVDSSYRCFAITCHKSWVAFFFKYVTVRDYKGSPKGMHWLCVVCRYPAWAVLAKLHAGVTYIHNIFEDGKIQFQVQHSVNTTLPCTTLGSSSTMLTIVMDVTTMTQSVPISSLNIVNGTSAGQGTWRCSLPAKFIDREQMSVQELMALKRLPHKTLDCHLHNQ